MDESDSKGPQAELYSSVLGTTTGLGSCLENHGFTPVFDLEFEPFVVPNSPTFKPFSALRGAIIAHYGLNLGSFHWFVHPNSPKVSLEKHNFDPFMTDFWSQDSPLSRHFVTLEWPKCLAMGSKRAHFTCLCTPNGLGALLEKHIFDPFLTLFLSLNSPFSRLFGILGGPKRATTDSKHAKITCFGVPCGPRSFFEKSSLFCTPWTLLTHVGTHLFGLSLAACRNPLGPGAGMWPSGRGILRGETTKSGWLRVH